jgi:glucose-6-phosphate 1-dehydrogenase
LAISKKDAAFLRKVLTIRQMDISSLHDFKALKKELQLIEKTFGAPTLRLFYLSIPPTAAQPFITLLGEAGITNKRTRLLLEKPFGTDLASATDLVENIKEYFHEEQLYRIDHYLAKEMAQNIFVFRNSNALFKRTWNLDFIESIEITASETIGIEGRSVFYEQTGALRDLVQSHLLQLAALVLMELPKSGKLQDIPAARLRALQSLLPPIDIPAQVTRGQYKGYQEEVDNPGSTVETFVRLTLFSADESWQGVPITLTTGKSLNQKLTEIRLRFKQQDSSEANTLVLRIQPNEGIEIDLWVKQPGYDKKLQKLALQFAYNNYYDELPEAYEHVLVDAMRGDHVLFTSSEEVLASWQILNPIQEHWSMDASDLLYYKPGASPDKL